MKLVTFVIGGARSGKSGFALSKASERGGVRTYIATASAFDEEMKDRIKKHRRERGPDWAVIEEPINLPAEIEKAGESAVVLADCLTIWLSNLMLENIEPEPEFERLEKALAEASCPVFLVSNEVGMGIVPENALARRFRDLAGILNQRIAALADEVYLVAAGLPLKIK